MNLDIKIYHGRRAPFSGVPSIREMLDTVSYDLPDYELLQVVDYFVFSLSGGEYVRYLVMYKKI